MDALNAGWYTLLRSDATLNAAATGGVWDSEAEPGTAFPYLVFQEVIGLPDYTFGNTEASLRFVMMTKAYARTTNAKHGKQLAEEIADRAKAVVRAGTLAVTGYTVQNVRWMESLAPMVERLEAEQRGQATYMAGALYEIHLQPAA